MPSPRSSTLLRFATVTLILPSMLLGCAQLEAPKSASGEAPVAKAKKVEEIPTTGSRIAAKTSPQPVIAVSNQDFRNSSGPSSSPGPRID